MRSLMLPSDCHRDQRQQHREAAMVAGSDVVVAVVGLGLRVYSRFRESGSGFRVYRPDS